VDILIAHFQRRHQSQMLIKRKKMIVAPSAHSWSFQVIPDMLLKILEKVGL
jgi:hypothetical protein